MLLLSETRACCLSLLVHRIFCCPDMFKGASSICKELVYYGAEVAESGHLCKSLVLQKIKGKNGGKSSWVVLE